jgi:hypothetical protein
MFVREVLLCQDIPAPPADVDTSIPEASTDARTLRERVAVHLQDPTCAGCHNLMDPIGLSFENFDGVGAWRDDDDGAPIDASGQLDGASFADAWDLGRALRDHDRIGACLTETMFRYAVGHSIADGEEAYVDWLADGFSLADHSVRALLADIATSPAFRTVGAAE